MAEQFFQVGIKGIIRNDDGNILLLRRNGDGGYERHWDIPGGRMEPGESFEQALARELSEEIGATHIGAPKFLAVALSNITIPTLHGRTPLVLIAYEIKMSNDFEVHLGEDEDEFDWVEAREAADRLAFKYPAEFTAKIKNL